MGKLLLIALAGSLALSGCRERVQDDVPVTPEALAWVAAEHLGDPALASRYPAAARRIGEGAVAASLSYDEAISVAVLPDPDGFDCEGVRAENADGCVETHGGWLAWALEEPEEDPGVVWAVVDKRDSVAVVISSGPTPITDDPRNLELAISVDDLFEVAKDPRVDLTTTREAVDGGEQIGYWGRPDV